MVKFQPMLITHLLKMSKCELSHSIADSQFFQITQTYLWESFPW